MNSNKIIDIGMHIGQDTEFYLKKGFQVLAIEPNAALVAQAEKKFSDEIQKGLLRILNVGISSRKETRFFYVNSNTSWSSFIPSLGMRDNSFIERKVDCITIQSILDDENPFYVKIDVEGFEKECLLSLFRARVKPEYISVSNPNTTSLDLLYSSGYTKFKVVNQSEVPRQSVQIEAEDSCTEYKFNLGSSGAFAEETPGEWKVYKFITDEVHQCGWADLHARF